jgi:hypothetical protein
MKLLVHLAPRRGAERALQARLEELGAEIASRAPAFVASVASMWRVEGDPFGPSSPWAGALEVQGAEGARASALAALAEGLDARFGDAVHADLCTALLGRDLVFIASQRAPVRYQYLMRRRDGFTHESYLRRYAELHSRFGFETPGIRGYVQLHVDPEATRALARAAGFGGFGVDSVSELHMDSLERFLADVARSSIGADATADEEVFVDRPNSHAFASRVTWHEVGPR